MTSIEKRKSEHLDIVLNRDVLSQSKTTGFERFEFEHCALPELDFKHIDLTCDFLNHRLKAPFIISSMTGGPEKAASINAAIAEAAGVLGIGFAVGSQRIALEGNGAAGFDRGLRKLAGNVPILANFGAAQLKQWHGTDMARRAVEMIEADALIVHLNPLQEVLQTDGDQDWSGLLKKIAALAKALPLPIVVKEIGCGISAPLAKQLWDIGVKIIDVAGAGGTSWAAVEGERAESEHLRAVAEPFRHWGISTAQAVMDVRKACPQATLIASGGIKDGVDAAKAIRLGADIVGLAGGILKAALIGPEALCAHFEILIAQLRIACFCSGSESLIALRKARLQSATFTLDLANG